MESLLRRHCNYNRFPEGLDIGLLVLAESLFPSYLRLFPTKGRCRQVADSRGEWGILQVGPKHIRIRESYSAAQFPTSSISSFHLSFSFRTSASLLSLISCGRTFLYNPNVIRLTSINFNSRLAFSFTPSHHV